MSNAGLNVVLFTTALITTGCAQQTLPPPATPQADSEFLLASEPDHALGVAEVRRSAADGQEVVVLGRIGGQSDPWVEGVAAFVLVDAALVPCNERPGDECPTPWDYCCEPPPQLNAAKLLVKLVDGRGQMPKTGARRLLRLNELQTVVVHGRAKRDGAGNVTVLADGVFVRS